MTDSTEDAPKELTGMSDVAASNTVPPEQIEPAGEAGSSWNSRAFDYAIKLSGLAEESPPVSVSAFDQLRRAVELRAQVAPGKLLYAPDSTAYHQTKRLDDEIHDLKSKLNDALAKSDNFRKTVKEHSAELDELHKRERLRHLLYRVDSRARDHLLEGGKLKDAFAGEQSVGAYVLSIDLRQSTVLMLKAREPRMFAEFLHELADKLRRIVVDCGGVFDKFTGDGVLAFFPDFYSGPDAGLLAVECASLSHSVFSDFYKSRRNCFDTVLLDVGLGVGIDRGQVSMVTLESELTVVGRPVVFACRLGAAPAGVTLANQPAYEKLLEHYSGYLEFEESRVHVKHEGETLAYKVKRNDKPFQRKAPDWWEETGTDSVGE